MSVTVTFTSYLKAVETLVTNVPAASASGNTITHDQFGTLKTLNASSTPPVSKMAAFQQALTAGAATIDLTSLTGTNGASVDGTGLRVQAIKFRNPAANDPMTIVEGAANSYDGVGADFSLVLAGGAEALLFLNDAGTDISGTNKTLDISGTAVEELDVEIIMG